MNELPQGPAGQDIQVQVGPQGQIGEVGPPPPLQTTFSAGEIVLFCCKSRPIQPHLKEKGNHVVIDAHPI